MVRIQSGLVWICSGLVKSGEALGRDWRGSRSSGRLVGVWCGSGRDLVRILKSQLPGHTPTTGHNGITRRHQLGNQAILPSGRSQKIGPTKQTGKTTNRASPLGDHPRDPLGNPPGGPPGGSHHPGGSPLGIPLGDPNGGPRDPRGDPAERSLWGRPLGGPPGGSSLGIPWGIPRGVPQKGAGPGGSPRAWANGPALPTGQGWPNWARLFASGQTKGFIEVR